VVDTLVAVLAGLMIFPAAFSVGINPDSGTSLVFITLPNVFNQAFAGMPILGWLVSLLFYALLALAALTSLISLHEVSTAFFFEELHISRKMGALIVSVSTCIIGIFCSLSLGDMDYLQIAGKSLFDVFDFVTGQILLPIGGFLTCLFIGWYVPKKIVKDEFTNWGTLSARFFGIYLFCVRIICPILILAIFLNQLGVIDKLTNAIK
jgi:neurotransmitter:Na+ symporter, NSS family